MQERYFVTGKVLHAAILAHVYEVNSCLAPVTGNLLPKAYLYSRAKEFATIKSNKNMAGSSLNRNVPEKYSWRERACSQLEWQLLKSYTWCWHAFFLKKLGWFLSIQDRNGKKWNLFTLPSIATMEYIMPTWILEDGRKCKHLSEPRAFSGYTCMSWK